MSRNLEVANLLKHAEETKILNLDASLKQLVGSETLSVISASEEPWELICYTWVTYIHRGPVSSIDEIFALSEAIQKSLAVTGVAGRVQRGG